jgi:hypothetical protein
MPLDGTNLDETTQIILDALDILRREGWCRGKLSDGEGRVCANGALVKAVTGTDPRIRPDGWPVDKFILARDRLAEACDCPIGKRSQGVPDFNNSRMTFTEIEDWFLRAASMAAVNSP